MYHFKVLQTLQKLKYVKARPIRLPIKIVPWVDLVNAEKLNLRSFPPTPLKSLVSPVFTGLFIFR